MASSYNGVPVPSDGKKISYANGKYGVPLNPVVPFIEGDGTGRDIWKASLRVFEGPTAGGLVRSVRGRKGQSKVR
jgi:isocitrate dehydrogenase